ncbi:galactosylceramide sulfotransferase-like [Glandiceps talaboti]
MSKDYSLFERNYYGKVVSKNRSTCSKVKNIVFLKTHKTGSDTTTKIFLQYGDLNNLSFVLPSGDWNLGWPSFIRSKNYLPSNKTFNILCLHTVYNKTQMHNLMPKDTKYVTILREPWKQFKSSFNYFKWEKYINDSSDESPVDTFLKNPGKFYRWDGENRSPYRRNFMAFDLGFPPSQYDNVSAIIEFINAIQQDFDLVMILEYFDESLVLLKRTFCWDMIDILYIEINISKYRYKIYDDIEHLYKHFSQVDIALYDHFKKALLERIARESEFNKELIHFKQVLSDFKMFCKQDVSYSNSLQLVVKESKWNEKFTIDVRLCNKSKFSVVSYVRFLKQKQYGIVSKKSQ